MGRKFSPAAAHVGASASLQKSLESSERFGPEFRLHQPWEFRRFFQGSDVLRLKECAIFRIPNTLGHFRLGATIKAKCNSVERNRAKRTLREFFRKNKEHFGSYDYNVVISGKRALDFEYARRLRKELEENFIHGIKHVRFKPAR